MLNLFRTNKCWLIGKLMLNLWFSWWINLLGNLCIDLIWGSTLNCFSTRDKYILCDQRRLGFFIIPLRAISSFRNIKLAPLVISSIFLHPFQAEENPTLHSCDNFLSLIKNQLVPFIIFCCLFPVFLCNLVYKILKSDIGFLPLRQLRYCF